MTTELRILKLENRLEMLKANGKENIRVRKKIERQLRNLKK